MTIPYAATVVLEAVCAAPQTWSELQAACLHGTQATTRLPPHACLGAFGFAEGLNWLLLHRLVYVDNSVYQPAPTAWSLDMGQVVPVVYDPNKLAYTYHDGPIAFDEVYPSERAARFALSLQSAKTKTVQDA